MKTMVGRVKQFSLLYILCYVIEYNNNVFMLFLDRRQTSRLEVDCYISHHGCVKILVILR